MELRIPRHFEFILPFISFHIFYLSLLMPGRYLVKTRILSEFSLVVSSNFLPQLPSVLLLTISSLLKMVGTSSSPHRWCSLSFLRVRWIVLTSVGVTQFPISSNPTSGAGLANVARGCWSELLSAGWTYRCKACPGHRCQWWLAC